ncbi:MAG: hypothetical protein KDB07_06500 [Planctomycetes bacterium]|nr:hypothetical protein [Planctomycetota bacterium]
MSETPKQAPQPTPPAPAPVPKAKVGGKRMAKVGVVALLIAAAAFLLNEFGGVDLGLPSLTDKGSESKSADQPNTPDATPSTIAAPDNKTTTQPTPDESGSTLPNARLGLRLVGAGFEMRLEPERGEAVFAPYHEFEGMLEALPKLFESWRIRQINVEIGVDFKALTKDEVMRQVRERLSTIKGAEKVTPNMVEIK